MSEFFGLGGDELSLKLYEAIERDYSGQAKRVFDSATCEICPQFMAFVTQYYHLSLAIPKEYWVFDLGSYAGAQGYFFRNHKKYVAIDGYDGERFKFENTINVKRDLREIPARFEGKTNNIFAICNYVPLNSEELRGTFKNIFCFYPTYKKKLNTASQQSLIEKEI